ncbi:type II toxin-antitoxin system RelE/ParE family toxin [Roseospira navarrensis]|uniref:Type II toxin-antitoxin system RelE/ParE family toxin n=1 Tax=Roseospira navarrensis TaxID=140058 RepID=A0A7X2D4R5_9PROT|nr:type II toxin-antitoxin system RelE/ParE family toxin [Roseospira navarrensis]MQX38136.1 type II toxin-antitoxin system RelE/ParE family toxin [Roseospira navarrensis]
MDVRFTVKAEDDSLDSDTYGTTRFGRAQADRYEQGLRHAISLIAETPRLAPERTEFVPPVRIHSHGSHAIVYLIRDDHILIVRILRADADMARHL